MQLKWSCLHMAGIIYCLESVPSRIRDHLLHRKKNAGKVRTEPSDILWLTIYHSSPVVSSFRNLGGISYSPYNTIVL
jgi:hypothetical protein